MDRITYNFPLDVMKMSYQRTIQGIQVGDTLSRRIVVTLRAGNKPYEFPTDNTVIAMMYVKKPNADTPSINACTINPFDGTITYDILQEDVETAGIVEMQMKILKTHAGAPSIVIVAPKFTLEIEDNNIEDSEAESTETYTALEEAIAQAQADHLKALKEISDNEDGELIFTYNDDTEFTSDAVIRAMNTVGMPILEGAEEAAESAIESAGEASASAGEASASASAASQSASEASTSASNASASASDASASATSASESATSASSSASSASASATSASESATSASSSATSAETSATEAAESAESASTSESNASSSASSASASATNAATSESNASASATSAAESATEASGYLASVIANSDMAEAWANGTIGGSPVPSTHPAYHNNAEYWKDQAEQIAGGEDLVKYTQQTRSSAEKAQARENIGAMASSDRGVANGVASLDAGGRIPYSQLPESAMEYKGTWDASTNTPTLADGVGTNGDFFIVSVGGTWNGIEFFANDRIIYDGALQKWQRIGGGNVISVAGKTGAVTLVKADVGLNNVNNTADLNKPISNATQTALNAKADLVSNPTTNNFVALTAEGNIKDSGKKASDFASASSITAGTIGTSSSTSGSSLSVPYVNVSAQGVVTGYGTHTHTVTGFASSSHNQAASTITAGTLGGRVQANASAASTLVNAQVRDIYATTTDLTAGSSSLSAGSICLVYEA